MVRKIMVSLAGAAILVTGAGAAQASPSPSPSAPAAVTAAGTAVSIPSGLSWFLDSQAYPGSDWAYSTVSNVWYDHPSNQNEIGPTPGAWQELRDIQPGSDYGNCVTLNWPANKLDSTPCTGKLSEEWASTCLTPSNCSTAGSVWAFFNEYMQNSHPTYCANRARAYITAPSSSGDLYMLCPAGPNGSIADTQQWDGEGVS